MGALLSSIRDAEEESKAHVPTPERPLRDVKGSKVHAPIVPVSIPNRPHNEPLHDAEEESEADVPPPDRPLPDANEQSKVNAPKSKRRALLVGITYKDSTDEVWTPLEYPHDDVDRFRELLINTYGYSLDDIVVLKDVKDDPSYPNHLQPTRTNMIRELKQLVSGAAPGDRFTFLFSGHSDQKDTLDDEEEDEDDVIITCDLGRIVSDEFNYHLVQNLPIGCSLSAIFNTSHPVTMLDLPHYRCNNIYVPWILNSNRRIGRIKTMHSRIVRGHAFDVVGLPGSASRQRTSTARSMSSHYWLSDTYLSSPLWIDTGAKGVLLANQREKSVEASRLGGSSILSPTRYDSPVSRMKCDGWCGYDLIPRATVVSLSVCADPPRDWGGQRGSLMTTFCEFLEKQPSPSYRTLMTHVNYQQHADYRTPHTYTLEEKRKAARKGPGLDGEPNNFQAPPRLSSLAKLNMDDTLRL